MQNKNIVKALPHYNCDRISRLILGIEPVLGYDYFIYGINRRRQHMNYALETPDQKIITLDEAVNGQHTMVVFVRHLG